MKFSATDQPARRRGPALLTRFEQAMKKAGHGDDALLLECIRRAFDKEDPASAQLLAALLARVAPPLKPVASPVEFDFPADGSPADKADAVLVAVAAGLLAPDDGDRIVRVISAAVQIREAVELEARLAALENAMKGTANG